MKQRKALKQRVTIHRPRASDKDSFLTAVGRSHRLHHPWMHPPNSGTAFKKYLRGSKSARHRSFLIWRNKIELVGVVNISEIVRSSFHSAYLGYYAFTPLAGTGLMRAGLAKVISYAFTKLNLHRLEANIQPANESSRRLVKRLGFRLEGYSPRYLKVAGRWRDHERWTILAEDWKQNP